MKLSPRAFRSISTHTLVAAIATNFYLISLLSDLYHLATRGFNSGLDAVYNRDMVSVMNLISSLAILVSFVSFVLYLNAKNNKKPV